MNDLFAKIKVTRATKVKPKAAVTAKVAREIKIPGPTTAKVSTIVAQVGGKAVPLKSGREDAIIMAGIRCKMAECKPKVDISDEPRDIESYKNDYRDFLAALDKMDFNSPIFGAMVNDTNVDSNVTPTVEVEPSVLQTNMVNGISVGDEVGGQLIIPAKKPRKKKSAKTVSEAETPSDSV